MKKITLFEGESRGSSEAASHAILFLVVISIAGTVSVGGDQAIERAQDGVALDQGVKGFVDAHKSIQEYTELGSDISWTTSGRSTNVKTVNSQVSNQQQTDIMINDSDGGDYTISTTPLLVDHNEFDLYYDAGVVASQTNTRDDKTVHWTPISNQQGNDGVIRFTTLSPVDPPVNIAADTTRIFVADAEQSEAIELKNGDRITIETNTPVGWEEHMRQYSFLDVDEGAISTSGDRKTIPADVDIGSGETVLVHHQKVNVEFYSS